MKALCQICIRSTGGKAITSLNGHEPEWYETE